MLQRPEPAKGATDGNACPTRHPGGMCRCEPRCAVCGWGEHDAIHGPRFGERPGSEPWGHQFETQLTAPCPNEGCLHGLLYGDDGPVECPECGGAGRIAVDADDFRLEGD